jgi:undecaprenyl-diphosphatase
MDAVWEWGLGVIYLVQSARGPALDAFFKAITFLGDEEFYLLLLPLILWCVDVGAGVRLFLVVMSSAYLNALLKDLMGHPRPFLFDPSVQVISAEGYCTPSGHAQSAVVIWGTLAATFRRRWLWILAAVLSLLIGFSRVYLGVHFPHSVLAGWAIGAIIVALYVLLESPVSAWLGRANLSTQLALALGVPLGALLLHPTPGTAVVMGAVMGAGAGMALQTRWVGFSAGGPWWQRVLRFAVGLVGVILVYVGLRLVFPAEGEPMYFAFRTIRYAMVGLWSTLGAPWLFRALKLASPAQSVYAADGRGGACAQERPH